MHILSSALGHYGLFELLWQFCVFPLISSLFLRLIVFNMLHISIALRMPWMNSKSCQRAYFIFVDFYSDAFNVKCSSLQCQLHN